LQFWQSTTAVPFGIKQKTVNLNSMFAKMKFKEQDVNILQFVGYVT